MKRFFAPLFNLGYWLSYGIFIMLFMTLGVRMAGSPGTNTLLLIIIGKLSIPPLLAFYTTYFFTFPKYLQKGEWQKGLIVLLSTAIACTLLALGFRFIAKVTFMPHVATNVTTSMFVVLGAFYFAHAIMGWVVKGFITWFKEYKLKQELTLANQNMELALLKSKMDPHFLFNTLNNLDALILTDPPRASEYLNKLSDILRFIVHQTDNHRIQIQSEIDYLNKYIDLQLLRSSNSNLVVRKFSSFESSKLTIAPVTFIPFVENAFKHGVLQNESIVVDIKPIDNGIVFTCTNKVGPKSVIENSPSIGNALIKQRLQSIYGNKHQLTFENASSQYRVNLTIHA